MPVVAHEESTSLDKELSSSGEIDTVLDEEDALSHENDTSSNENVAEKALSLDENILELRSLLDNDSEHLTTYESAMALRELGRLLRRRFSESKVLSDIDEAIEVHRRSLTLLPSPHPSQPSLLSHYGFVLHDRFHHTNNMSDIHEATSQHQKALDILGEGDVNQFSVLENLSNTLRCRFVAGRAKADLDRAISLRSKALILRPSDQHSLEFLAKSLERRVEIIKHTENPDIDQIAADLHQEFEIRQKLSLLTPGNSDHGLIVNEVATSFFNLFLDTERVNLLEEAISILREGRKFAHLPPRDEILILANLSVCLGARYERFAEPGDLEEAIGILHHCIAYPTPVPATLRAFTVSALCRLLQNEHRESGQASKLAEVITRVYLFFSSPEVNDIEDSDRVRLLLVLGTALRSRFLLLGRANIKDLEDSAKFLQEAREISPSYEHRVEITECLVETLILQHHAEGTISGPSGNPAFMDKVINLQQEVVNEKSRINTARRARSLTTLARAWKEKYLCTRALQDLDASIKYQKEAIELSSSVPRARSIILNDLVDALHRRYSEYSRNVEDLDLAIVACRQAISDFDRLHHRSSIAYSNLGDLFTKKFKHSRDRKDLCAATDAFRVAVLGGGKDTTQQFFAAQKWAELADKFDHESAMEAYTLAVRFLPRLSVLGIDLSTRQRILTATGTDGMARVAASFAIRSGQYEKAVEFLEEGRSVFWSQALQLRASFSDLRKSKAPGPAIADQLEDISRKLEEASLRSASWNWDSKSESSHESRLHTESQGVELGKLDEEWQLCIEKARQIQGFENFLSPKSFADLRAVSRSGTVVILNISGYQADALVLKSPLEEILHVPLPQLTPSIKIHLGKVPGIIRGAVDPVRSSTGEPSRAGRPAPTIRNEDDPETVLQESLAMLWTIVVEPIIRALDLKKSAYPPRIWWCPTGEFVSLPIHAAGIYNTPGAECLADYAVSSYLPTLSTLLGPPPVEVQNINMLVVIQPHSKGHLPLPATEVELKKIKEIVPPNLLVSYGLKNFPATVSTVLDEISKANVVHFACHGQQNALNPLDSALVLEDGLLKVPQLMELSLKQGSLVFLSACQTASGDKNLPDELLNLATTLLFCGFRGAIGTMWSIQDKDGPIIAEAFYRHLFLLNQSVNSYGQVSPRTSEASRAIHAAVAMLRQMKRPFLSWVPFIHLGY